jgi:hypothetical protein
MNKTQRYNYDALQLRCDQIAAMGKVLVDLADGTLCEADPEDVQDADIERAEAMISHLIHIFADPKMEAHCRKLGIETTEDWAEVYHNLPDLLNKTH